MSRSDIEPWSRVVTSWPPSPLGQTDAETTTRTTTQLYSSQKVKQLQEERGVKHVVFSRDLTMVKNTHLVREKAFQSDKAECKFSRESSFFKATNNSASGVCDHDFTQCILKCQIADLMDDPHCRYRRQLCLPVCLDTWQTACWLQADIWNCLAAACWTRPTLRCPVAPIQWLFKLICVAHMQSWQIC